MVRWIESRSFSRFFPLSFDLLTSRLDALTENQRCWSRDHSSNVLDHGRGRRNVGRRSRRSWSHERVDQEDEGEFEVDRFFPSFKNHNTDSTSSLFDQIPIILICNDKGNQKMKPLMSTTFQMPFRRSAPFLSLPLAISARADLDFRLSQTFGSRDPISNHVDLFQVRLGSSLPILSIDAASLPDLLLPSTSSGRSSKSPPTSSTNSSTDPTRISGKFSTCSRRGNSPRTR